MNINIKEVPRAATHCKADGADGYECPLVQRDDDDWICHGCDYLWPELSGYLEVDQYGNPVRSDTCIASEMASFDEADAHRKADAAEEERNAYCIDERDGTDQNGMCQTCRAKGLAPSRKVVLVGEPGVANAWLQEKVQPNPCDDRHPCAKCGNEALAYKTQLIRNSKGTGRRLHWIECIDCRHKGQNAFSEGEAVHYWNAENPKACGCPGGPIEHRMDCRRRDPA